MSASESGWRLKCPSCDDLMGEGMPYKTLASFSSPGAAPFDDAPIAGYKYRCTCGCTVDIPSAESPTTVEPTETHGPHYTLSYIESTIQRLSNRGLTITPVDVLTGLLKLHARGIKGDEAETDLYAFLERLSPFVYSCSWFSYSTFPGWVTVAGILNNAADVDRINAFGHSLARVVAVMRILP